VIMNKFIADPQNFLTIVDSWKGTPFRHHSGVKGIGVDCVHFIEGVLFELHYPPKIPFPGIVDYTIDYMIDHDYSLMLQEFNKYLRLRRVLRSELQIGDLLAFKVKKTQSHAGFYYGSTQFIHAENEHGVKVSSLRDLFWKRGLTDCFVLEV
jgi:hypothetical protein